MTIWLLYHDILRVSNIKETQQLIHCSYNFGNHIFTKTNLN